jgi:hypothetical protein
LKQFYLYCQMVESLYADWKSYWLGVLMK